MGLSAWFCLDELALSSMHYESRDTRFTWRTLAWYRPHNTTTTTRAPQATLAQVTSPPKRNQPRTCMMQSTPTAGHFHTQPSGETITSPLKNNIPECRTAGR